MQIYLACAVSGSICNSRALIHIMWSGIYLNSSDVSPSLHELLGARKHPCPLAQALMLLCSDA